VEHAATGIYFRVIKTGSVASGDKVSLHQAHPARLSVQRLFKAYFDKTLDESEKQTVMREALEIEALSIEWREKLESRVA
jgi:MOSC domain-containing protein YiiM